jgi:hypothetical protein
VRGAVPGVPQSELSPTGGNVVDWLALFEQEKVQFAILDRRTDSGLVGMLRRRRGWIAVFEDNKSVIFTRESE